jgi:RHS repeat-associated protein
MTFRTLTAAARRRGERRPKHLAWATTMVMVGSLVQVATGPVLAQPGDHEPKAVEHGKTAPARAAAPTRPHKGSVLPKLATPVPVPKWPTPAKAQLDKPGTAAVGGLPITFTPRRAATVRAAVTSAPLQVETLDRQASAAAGVAGPIVRVGKTAEPATIALSYRDFASAYGGDFGGRLRLVRLPDCALSTPGKPGCTPQPVEGAVNDTENKVLTTTVQAGPATTFAMIAAETSTQGNYGATALTPASKWEVAPSSGGYNWSYPISLPPVPGSNAPSVTLSYNSQTVDGRTTTTNNQGSWVGEGFGYEPGYIERQYKSCSDDGHATSPDLCWAYDNATIMLNGRSGTLVRSGSTWKFANDDGSTIRRVTDTSKNNGDNDGEHWVVTTTDGNQYFFGLNRLPGWTTDKPETASTWTVPVYGDDATNAEDPGNAAEPCYNATFSKAYCQQAWRWNLDYVKDLRGNVVSYFYERESNAYALAGKTDVTGTTYHRGGFLKRIDYGQRDGAVYTSNASARVVFDTAERCLPRTGVTCNPGDLTDATALNWEDTPTDRICAPGTKCKATQLSPTFFTRKRLTGITTQIRTATTWVPVNGWTLGHTFINNGDGSRSLWLNSITHSGWGGTTTNPITQPTITLEPLQLPNRIDRTGDNIAPLVRPRLGTVLTESGAQVDVTYEDADCSETSLPVEGKSTRRCYPVKWAPGGEPDPITDWFHKYVVREVIETDRVGQAPDQVTRYDYLGDAGWRYSDATGLTKDENKYRTWNQWRGYKTVKVTRGDGQTMTTRTEHTYLRGLHGDKNPDGGTRPEPREDSTGTSYTDLDEFAAYEIETAVYNGNTVITKTLTKPALHQSAAVTRAWGTDKSVMVLQDTVRGLSRKADGTWRETKSSTEYDTAHGGRVTQVNNLGDLSTTADDQCTTNTYADNPALNIYTRVSRKETVAVACGVTPNRATQVLGDERTYYDGLPTLGAAPTIGNPTKTERLAEHNGTTATYAVTGESTFDTYGRPLVVKDAAGTTLTHTYTDTNGRATKMVATGPLGNVTTEYSPVWGHKTADIDANNKRADLLYDKLGRLTEVRLPERLNSTSAALKYTYLPYEQVSQTYAKPVAVKTEKLKRNGTYRVEYTLYDGFLRPRQIQAEGPDGGRLVSETFYTGTGQVAQTNDTHHAAGPPSREILPVRDGDADGQTRLLYDGADRVTATITLVSGVEKWRTTTIRDGADRTTVIPPHGDTTATSISDARGQVLQLRQYHGRQPTGDHDTTYYTYTPNGQLSTVTDPAGNTWEHFYDQRGRKVRTLDPDAGESRFGYDDLDRLVSTTDARQVTISHKYDTLSRKTETWNGEVGSGTLLASWEYDTTYKGHLYSAIRHVDGHKLEVRYPFRDAAYRPQETMYVIPKEVVGDTLAGIFRFKTAYNSDGTVQSTGFPAVAGATAEGVVYTYDDLQRVTAIEGKVKYVSNMEYARTGQLLKTSLDAGGRKAWAQATYEAGTNRMTSSKVAREAIVAPDGSGDNIPVSDVDKEYEYDHAGNVLSVADTPGSGHRDIQCFTYDYLRRMTEAWTSAATGEKPCDGGPAATGVGGVAPYHQSYTIDKVGNRTGITHHAVGGSGQTSRTYDYAAAGPAHAVDTITESTPNGDRLHTYTYDQVGNTRERVRAGEKQTLQWDPEGQLASVTENNKTTSFIYTADGDRLVRKEAGVTTLYLAGMELRHNSAFPTSAAEITKFYPAGNGAIVVRTATGLQFQFGDHHGTGQTAVDVATGQITHRRSDPFGNPRGTPPATGAWQGEKGFVGGNQDTSTGLTHLGARLYEPENGRFISVDPLINTNDPQQMNAYTYSINNPITFSDPSGLTLACGRGDDTPCPGGKPSVGPHDVTGGGNSTPSGGSSTPAGVTSTPTESHEARAARERAERAKQQLIDAGKALGKVIADELGITDALNCVTTGDLGACGETLLNVAEALVGGVVTKLIRKYGAPWKWDRARQLGQQIWDLGGKMIDGLKTWVKENKLYQAIMSRCQTHSFAPGTRVLLANGTTKPIEKLKPGDKVAAHDPETGKSGNKTVAATHVHQDREFTDLKVIDSEGRTHTLKATQNHPFWNVTTKAWADAADLNVGDKLYSPDEGNVRVQAVTSYTGLRTMHDLTIADIHTYFVLANDAPVLVHNCGGSPDHRPGLEFTDAERQKVYDENEARNGVLKCDYCTKPVYRRPSRVNGMPVRGKHDDAQIDHRIPKDLGGCGAAHNGCVACRACNRDKTNQTVEQWDARTMDDAGMLLDATGLNLINL